MGRFVKGSVCWKKGTKKIQDPNEIRQCKECGEKKIVTAFIRGAGDLYRYKCKECGNKKNRTGKPNEGRFKPGHTKGVRYQKGNVPWYKQKGLEHPCKGIGNWESDRRFYSLKYKEWKRQVFELKGKRCEKCGSKKRLGAHHIVPWKDDENLRFDVNNGMPICASCHGKIEGFQKFFTPHNKQSGEVLNKVNKQTELITMLIEG